MASISAAAFYLLKTTQAHLLKCCNLVIELHPYELPELIVLPIVSGYTPYLEWIKQSLSE